MYDVTYEIDGILKHISIKADDGVMAQQIFTNMFSKGFGNIQIINVRRI